MLSNDEKDKVSSCPHLKAFRDLPDAFTVCLNCGKVLQHPNTPDNNALHFWNENDVRFVKEESLELCSRSHLPIIFAQDIALKYVSVASPQNFDSSLLGVCFYQICKIQGCPRTLRECAALIGLPEKKLTPHLRRHFFTTPVIRPQHLVSRLGQLCGLKREQTTSLEKCMIQNDKKLIPPHSFSPTTVTATYIYLYGLNFSLDISVSKISKIIGVSPIAIHRFRQFLYGSKCLSFGPKEEMKKSLERFLGQR
jgi:transcription initiation factor TFIIIB Brf1 subunit/transcription initiation factor TFIIB